MRLTIIISAVLLLPIFLMAQDKYFQKELIWGQTHEVYSLSQKQDHFYISGSNTYNGQIGWRSFLAQLGTDGSLDQIWNHTDTFDFYQSILWSPLLDDTNTLYSVGELSYMFGQSPLVPIVSNVDISQPDFSRQIYNPAESHPDSLFYLRALRSIQILDDKIWAIGGSYNNDSPIQLYSAIINKNNLLIEWDTLYPVHDFNSYFYKSKLRDNKLIAMAHKDDRPALDEGEFYLTEIDSIGTRLWEWAYDIGLDEKPYDFDITSDGGYVICGVEQQNEIYELKGHIVRLDGSRNVIWQSVDIIPQFNALSIEALDNNEIVVCGSYYKLGETFLTGTILKLNSAGELLWQRDYPGIFHIYLHDMICVDEDKSGLSGYAICGRKDSTTVSPAYFLKLNCMGLNKDPIADFTFSEAGETILFQNTSHYIYADSIDGGYYVWDFGDETTVVQETDSINSYIHSYASPGVYTVTLTGYVCNDTVVKSITLNSEALSAEEESIVSPFLYPNPSTGIFYITQQEQGKIEVNVFNESGQKILDLAPLEYIDLRSFPDGIYYYEFIQNDNIHSGKLLKSE